MRDCGLVEGVHVYVRDAGVAALGLAVRPAGDLDAGKAVVRCEIYDLLKAVLGNYSGVESQFHFLFLRYYLSVLPWSPDQSMSMPVSSEGSSSSFR